MQRKLHVRYLFTGDRGHAAAAVSLADVYDARCDGSNLLIDCGEGTQIALKEKGWSPKPVDVICFTHYHADHISGLPGFHF